MSADLKTFGERLAALPRLRETATAIAILWFLDQSGAGEERTAQDLARTIHHLSLRGAINASRLHKRLAAHRDVVRGKAPGTFRIRLAAKAKLLEEYGPLVGPVPAKVDDRILSQEDFEGCRKVIRSIVHQINGTYQFAFYDACVVLCRRLIEVLLIESFVSKGHEAAILRNGQYVQFGEMIKLAQGGNYVRLARGAPRFLEKVKLAGDTGAHDRYHSTRQADVDELTLEMRKVVTELAHLSGLAKSGG